MSHVDYAKLKARLKAAGRTQRELADQLGIGSGEVSKYLSGKHKMGAERYLKIEAFLAAAERNTSVRGVAEERVAFERAPVRFVTLEEARKIGPAPPMSPEESERWRKDILALGEAGKRLPRITDMSDDEILGYDEME